MIHVPHLRLCEGGSIAGEAARWTGRWTVRDQQLRLLDDTGREAVRFDAAQFDGDGRAVLFGREQDGSAQLLQEVAGMGRLAPRSSLQLLGPGRTVGRPHLVIVRANENSIHPRWTDDLSEPDRSWDLCVSWYGKAESFGPADRTEYAVLQNRFNKLPALYRLLHEESPLWDYDYIAIVDDDMHFSRNSINVLFETCREYRLELAQPSLHPESIVTQFETRQQRAFVLRYVNYVEPMMAIFSRKALQACIGTFELDEACPEAMGYGIDYAWPKLIQGPPSSVAIIDKVAATHTRAHAINYDLDTARLKGKTVASLFGHQDYLEMKELGGVYATPVRRNLDYEASAAPREYMESRLVDMADMLAAADKLRSGWYEPELARLTGELAQARDMLVAADALKSGWYEPELGRLAAEVTRLNDLLAAADALKSGWHEPELARLTGHLAHARDLLAAADALKSGWHEPELARLTGQLAHARDMLAAADALKSGWYEPELARLAGELERLTTSLQTTIDRGSMARGPS